MSPCSKAAICSVLGAGTPRLPMLALKVHHRYTGYRFPEGLHIILILFHYLHKEHLASEDCESCRTNYLLEDEQLLRENGSNDQNEGNLELLRLLSEDFFVGGGEILAALPQFVCLGAEIIERYRIFSFK